MVTSIVFNARFAISTQHSGRSTKLAYLYLIVGAIAGAVLRYQLGMWFALHGAAGGAATGGGFPWMTLLINVSGSFLLGVIIGSLGSVKYPPHVALMLTTGFCGSFTTFSTFSLESMHLMQKGAVGTAMIYIGVSVIAALAATFAGFALAKAFR